MAATEAEVERAVVRARAAHESWSHVPLSVRISKLKKAAKEMLVRRDEVMRLAHAEMGKSRVEGLFNEALGPLETLAGWAKVVSSATARRYASLNPLSFPNKTAYVDYVPRGVVGIIAPWNYPVSGLYRATFPALLTGNGVVVKPSEYTPKTSSWFVERLAEALPTGLIEAVNGDGAVGAHLIGAGIDACVFTGSPATGRKVRVRCAELGVVASVELGGKDGAIVLGDCDLERTVAGVTHWALSNAGQACGAIEIAYVDAHVADAFVRDLAAAWRRLKVGGGDTHDVAPLANRAQLELVTAHVNDAKAKGGTIACGGTPTGDGFGFQPTVIDHCREDMAVVRDETFGPVLAIVRVDGADEAVRKINRSRYGLGASIWTADIERAERLAGRLDVGVVTINNHAVSGAIPSLPWSGTRDTGSGIANGPESLGTFVRPRTVLVDRGSSPEVYFMPYDRELMDLGERLADAQIGRVLGAWKVPLSMRSRTETVRSFYRR